MGLSPSLLTTLPLDTQAHILGFLSPGYEWYLLWSHEKHTDGVHQALNSLVIQGTPYMVANLLQHFPLLFLEEPLALALLQGDSLLTDLLRSHLSNFTSPLLTACQTLSTLHRQPKPHGRHLDVSKEKALCFAIKQGYHSLVNFFISHAWWYFGKGMRRYALFVSYTSHQPTLEKSLRKMFTVPDEKYRLKGDAYLDRLHDTLTAWHHSGVPPSVDIKSVGRWLARGGHQRTLQEFSDLFQQAQPSCLHGAAYGGHLTLFIEILPRAINRINLREFLIDLSYYCLDHLETYPVETFCALVTHLPHNHWDLMASFSLFARRRCYPVLSFLVQQGVILDKVWAEPIRLHDIELAQWYLDHGANPEEGLLKAVICQDLTFMEFFIQAGACDFNQAACRTIHHSSAMWREDFPAKVLLFEEGLDLLRSHGITDYEPFVDRMIQWNCLPALSYLQRHGFRDYGLGLKVAAIQKNAWWVGMFTDLGARNHTAVLTEILCPLYKSMIDLLIRLGANLDQSISDLPEKKRRIRREFLNSLRGG